MAYNYISINIVLPNVYVFPRRHRVRCSPSHSRRWLLLSLPLWAGLRSLAWWRGDSRDDGSEGESSSSLPKYGCQRWKGRGPVRVVGETWFPWPQGQRLGIREVHPGSSWFTAPLTSLWPATPLPRRLGGSTQGPLKIVNELRCLSLDSSKLNLCIF